MGRAGRVRLEGKNKEKLSNMGELLFVREPSLEWGAAVLSLTSQHLACVDCC
jgi:hypothetical protein